MSSNTIPKNFNLFFILLLIFSITLITPALAKKKKKLEKDSIKITQSQERINNLSPEEKRKFEALSKKQQKIISRGDVDKGFNAWMVELAWGKPYYGTEHHPIYTDFEEVWLYTKPHVIREINENKIIDPQTNWPTIHRFTKTKTCQVGDIFLLWDRGIVNEIKKADTHTVHGSCTIETEEVFLPIVEGQANEPSGKK